MNYIGYFKSLNDTMYSVKLIGEQFETTFTEILLGGAVPFEVNYNASATPFEPVRTSTATITIVHNSYLEDILSPYAQGTQVILTNENKKTIEWVGYLTPKIYDQSYESCMETIQLEAADCISSLQYIDYKPLNDRGLVNIKDIIGRICDECGLLDGFYWTRSKKIGNTILLPNHLGIYEQNFFSNDTDEPWKMDEVLKEICMYLGFTCLQWKGRMYFVDYDYLGKNNDLYCTWYAKQTNYGEGSSVHLDATATITGDNYMLNGASITFEPIYNKITVYDNLYCLEDFIPSMTSDDNLVNRNGEFYKYFQVQPETPDKASFPDGTAWFSQKYTDEETPDSDYLYFYRLYDNNYWESVYGEPVSGTPTTVSEDIKKTASITRDYMGGTLLDLGTIAKAYRNEGQQLIIPNKLDYTRYLCISEKHNNARESGDSRAKNYGNHVGKVVYRLKPGYKSRCLVSNDSFLVLNCSGLWERYQNRAYINPDWCSDKLKVRLTAGTSSERRPSLMFRLKIGDKYWNGANNEWTTTDSTFSVEMEFDSKKTDYWNKSLKVLNNVTYEEYVNQSGYKIPLEGVDLSEVISFEILCPNPTYMANRGNPSFENVGYENSAYIWIKDFSLKLANKGQDVEKQENDILYENVIDENAINELRDIKFRITTYSELTQPSFSHMINMNTKTFLDKVTEASLSNNAQKPEENCIERYYNQYSTQTKKLEMTFGTQFTPFQKITGCDVDSPTTGYVPLGTSINYAMDRQTITYIQKK